jgi:adenylosuccinate lyase
MCEGPDRSKYVNPLIDRYASPEMSWNFSDEKKFRTWRRLWTALAEAERKLGLPITKDQVAALKAACDDIDFAAAAEFEREVRHDVMAHVHTFGKQCPEAKGIIHLGATSAFVGDNTDLIQIRDALDIVLDKLAALADALGGFAAAYRDTPAVGFTHFQPAQLTTVGKRACLWLHDVLLDIEEIEFRRKTLKFRGTKGATGTQASYLALFDGDAEKVLQLDTMVARAMGFKAVYPVTGQTYARKVDSAVLGSLSGAAQSLHKMANDIRLLQSLRELEEPFAEKQIGSSAMAYKRNPMRSERICSLARHVIANAANPAFTAAAQWLERTLDDSANRRLSIPEAFLAADGILEIALNVTRGLKINPAVIARRVAQELPFVATEEIMMAATKAGGDRQQLHEQIRRHSMAAAARIKEGADDNDLLERIERDPAFEAIRKDLQSLVKPDRFVGLAPEQVDRFLAEHLAPVRKRYKDVLGRKVELKV